MYTADNPSIKQAARKEEEALLFAMFLRNEKQTWIPRRSLA
jgi:hypothetical protein